MTIPYFILSQEVVFLHPNETIDFFTQFL